MKSFFDAVINESVANQKLSARRELVINVTEDILIALEKKGLSKSDLAKRLGKSRAYVSQILDGNRNMTLGSLSDICYELGVKPDIKIGSFISHDFVKEMWHESNASNVISHPKLHGSRRVHKTYEGPQRWTA